MSREAIGDPGIPTLKAVFDLLVDLRRIGWKNPDSIPALERAGDVFLRTYLSRSRPEVRDRLPTYAAAICLQLASRDIRRQAAEKAAAMLDEGRRILAHGL